MFLVLNIDFMVKSHGCYDCREHNDKYSKDDTASPTASLEGIIITSEFESHENSYTNFFNNLSHTTQ